VSFVFRVVFVFGNTGDRLNNVVTAQPFSDRRGLSEELVVFCVVLELRRALRCDGEDYS
jgi:hypothetical protein